MQSAARSSAACSAVLSAARSVAAAVRRQARSSAPAPVPRSLPRASPRPGGYRYYQNGCYVEQPGGWVAVSPRYCQTAGYDGPPPRAYVEPQRPRCTYSPSYDPRRGTFIGRDGYERPCP